MCLYQIQIRAPSFCPLTISELGVRQLQVFAGSGWVVLGAHGVLQPLNVLFEVIQGGEDILHALAVVQPRLISLHLGGAPCLLRGPDWQRLDDLTRRTLQSQDKVMSIPFYPLISQLKYDAKEIKVIYSQEDRAVRPLLCRPLDHQDPDQDTR